MLFTLFSTGYILYLHIIVTLTSASSFSLVCIYNVIIRHYINYLTSFVFFPINIYLLYFTNYVYACYYSIVLVDKLDGR